MNEYEQMTYIHGVHIGQPTGSFPCQYFSITVKTRVRLLTKTLKTWSLLRRGTWPQLMCCALVAVWVPEVGRGQVGVSEQGGSSDDDQDSE